MDNLWLLTAACAGATYLPRGLGVLFSGRIRVDGEAFKWIACVAYAMVAGLVARTIVLPSGMLAESFLLDRMLACTVGLAAYFFAVRRNLVVAVVGAVAVLIACGYLRALIG